MELLVALAFSLEEGFVGKSILPLDFQAFSTIAHEMRVFGLHKGYEDEWNILWRVQVLSIRLKFKVCYWFCVISPSKGICPLAFQLSCYCWGLFGLPEAIRCPNSQNNRNNICFHMVNSCCLIVTKEWGNTGLKKKPTKQQNATNQPKQNKNLCKHYFSVHSAPCILAFVAPDSLVGACSCWNWELGDSCTKETNTFSVQINCDYPCSCSGWVPI